MPVLLMPLALFLVGCLHAATAAPLSITVGVRLPSAQVGEIERIFWEVSNPSSALHQQYLSLESVRRLRAADPGEVGEVQAWLGSVGCTQVALSPAGDSLSAQCPVRPVPVAGSKVDELVDYVHSHGSSAETSTLPQTATGAVGSPRPNLGTPVRQREFYSIPESQRSTNETNAQMVWGCGTFGVNKTELGMYYSKYCTDCELDKVSFDTEHHGTEPGDNFDEGTLDTTYISSFGKGVPTIVSNTNISMSTEEGEAQGAATVYFMEHLADRSTVPFVLSLSLGSLSFGACDRLCLNLVASNNSYTYEECHSYMQHQRQICLYASTRYGSGSSLPPLPPPPLPLPPPPPRCGHSDGAARAIVMPYQAAGTDQHSVQATWSPGSDCARCER